MLNNLSGGDLVIVLISIILSMAIHEAMHAYASYLLGDTTAKDMGRISLNPLHHIDPFTTVLLPIITIVLFKVPILAAKPVPFNPDRLKFDEFGAAMVAAAGPLANLVLAVIAAFILGHVVLSESLANILTIFTTLNVALFAFNIIPIPPLDGSRVLYAFAPEPLQELLRVIEPYGLFLIFGLVLSGVLTPLLVSLNSGIINHLP